METRAEAFENVAGLLTRMGYIARVEPAYRPAIPGCAPKPSTVLALVTCAPEMVIGMCLGQVAVDPEAHIPTQSRKVPKAKQWDPGDPLFAYWCEEEERP